jgi:hypothetical protein
MLAVIRLLPIDWISIPPCIHCIRLMTAFSFVYNPLLASDPMSAYTARITIEFTTDSIEQRRGLKPVPLEIDKA